MPNPAIPELAALIAASGETCATVAKRAQISRVHLSNLLRGRFNPSLETAERLAQALHTTVDRLGVTISTRSPRGGAR